MVGNDFMNWKDVQMGEDLKVFGRSYRIVACDEFTKVSKHSLTLNVFLEFSRRSWSFYEGI